MTSGNLRCMYGVIMNNLSTHRHDHSPEGRLSLYSELHALVAFTGKARESLFAAHGDNQCNR